TIHCTQQCIFGFRAIVNFLCDLVLDAAHRKSPEPSIGPRKEDIVESIIFKASDVVVVTFKDVDLNFARKGTEGICVDKYYPDNFTDVAVSGRINGEHKEKDLEPWDGGETHNSDSLESLDTDVSNGWDPNDMFKYNEEKYGVLSTYDSSLSTYTVPLERDNSEEFLKREARAAQLAEEIEASAAYKARVALENDERTEEEKYTAVVRGERETHTLSRESKYIPPGQRNREAMSWGPGRPRLGQGSAGPSTPRSGPHDYSPSSGADQRVVNGGPPRMSPKSQRTPRAHRVPPCRTTGVPPGVDLISHNAPGEIPVTAPTRSSSSGGTWSSVCLKHDPCLSLSTHLIGPPNMAPDHRKQIDNLKKFSVDFRLQSSSNPDPAFDQLMTKPPRETADKPKDLPLDKASTVGREGTEEAVVVIAAGTPGGAPAPSPTATNSSKPGSPAALSPSPSAPDQKRAGLDVTSQGVQTTATSTFSGTKQEEKEEKKEAVQDQVRKSTLNPNANEFKPRFNTQPKPANTPTPPRPQGQPSPSIVVQQPPAVYSCFPQMYPLTPVSPGVQSPAMYQVQLPHMTVSQTKPYRPVPNMPQQRSDQHHPPGTPTMMHPATAAGPPIVAPSPAYSAQYFTCSPQQFTSQPLVQQMPHYQSQAQHVFGPVMQGSARMMAPTHGQPSLVSSSTTQYPEQTHTMYVSPGPMPQQYPHPSATLHPHPQHPQPSATPTGQAQQGGPPQHGGPPSHPAASPVQHPQAAAAAQALHLANQPPQQQMYSALAPTPPSMTPGPNPQSPQASFPSAQQTVYIHPQQVQHGYNPNHMAHVQQAHMQSGIVQSHHPAPTHPPMMLMATQGPPGGPQPPMPQTALNPIPVSSTTHFSYLAQVQPHHQQQL
uniref:Ataxin 2 n=1 Tax=Mastacembelus armatus TaxID=205130 RepID=A0A7N8Y8E5_9TELE